MNYLEDPKDKLKIRLPYEKYIDNEGGDLFHILTNFQIHIRSGGYNAYVRNFAVYYSEQEIENSKFQSLTKKFNKIEKESDLLKTQLKVLNKEILKDDGVKIYEFDVSNKAAIEKWYKTRVLPFYPLLWIEIQQKHINKTVDYTLRQNVAAKFVSMKLIKSSNTDQNSNIDLYNLGLKGIPLVLESSGFD